MAPIRERIPAMSTALLVVLFVACDPGPTTSPVAVETTASPSPITSIPATPAPTVATPSLPAPTLPSSAVLTDWTLNPMPFAVRGVFGGNLASDVVRFGSGFVAVGTVNAGCCDGGFSEQRRAIVWRSTDGKSWDLVPDQAAFRYRSIGTVFVTDGHLIAFGTRNLEVKGWVGAIWTSIDGTDWELAGRMPLGGPVAATDGGFVTITNPETGPVLWTSSNGIDWTKATADLGPGRADRIVAFEDSYLMVGLDGEQTADGWHSEAVVWSSTDGSAWQRAPEQEALSNLSIHDVGRIGNRFVAIGSPDNEDGAAVLTSLDGLTWTRLAAPAFSQRGLRLEMVMSRDDVLLVTGTIVGDDDSRFVALTTNDGEHWAQIQPAAGDSSIRGEMSGWLALEHGFLAVGSAPRGTDIAGPTAWRIQ